VWCCFCTCDERRNGKKLNLEPIARLVNFASAGVEPRIMGIGPVKAIPKY
jgi:acetyl-CoA acetyltransferase